MLYQILVVKSERNAKGFGQFPKHHYSRKTLDKCNYVVVYNADVLIPALNFGRSLLPSRLEDLHFGQENAKIETWPCIFGSACQQPNEIWSPNTLQRFQITMK